MRVSKPLVTIYIPTHNRKELLERAVNSVLNQSYPNIELVIVNDGSEDDTYEYLESIKSDLIKVFHNDTSFGACFSRNLAINNATGDYITGLDDDDYFSEQRITHFVNEMSSLDDDVFILFDNCLIKTQSRTIKIKQKRNFASLELYKSNFIGNQIFASRSMFSELTFDVSFKALQDWDAWLSILERNENIMFKSINKNSYIVDLSHPHERITNSSYEKIQVALFNIALKHGIDMLDIFSCYFFNYFFNKSSMSFEFYIGFLKKTSLILAKRSVKFVMLFFAGLKNRY